MSKLHHFVKHSLKSVVNMCTLVAALPLAATCWLQQAVYPQREEMFAFWGHVLSLAPGLIGMYLRRSFYRLTLDECAADVFIGFGALFSCRRVQIESGAYVGPYAIIGSALLRRNCLIGSRASLLSGGKLHVLDKYGNWTPTDNSRMEQIEIGEHAWLGEGVIVMANVGSQSMVAAGAVVSTAVPERLMVGGNPARFIKRLEPDDPSNNAQQSDTSPESTPSTDFSAATI